ncbi:hypothetical protein IWQ62_000576 [Dispira parvispora]|uniref:Uncharacterized protein n=1 Tax=Dispira parvispora TaxID=1520584 RepID=A0A9W8B107_9FUNG|nr:hypothetical protein IWQ62_000576 [Dispira parvispora]
MDKPRTFQGPAGAVKNKKGGRWTTAFSKVRGGLGPRDDNGSTLTAIGPISLPSDPVHVASYSRGNAENHNLIPTQPQSAPASRKLSNQVDLQSTEASQAITNPHPLTSSSAPSTNILLTPGLSSPSTPELPHQGRLPSLAPNSPPGGQPRSYYGPSGRPPPNSQNIAPAASFAPGSLSSENPPGPALTRKGTTAVGLRSANSSNGAKPGQRGSPPNPYPDGLNSSNSQSQNNPDSRLYSSSTHSGPGYPRGRPSNPTLPNTYPSPPDTRRGHPSSVPNVGNSLPPHSTSAPGPPGSTADQSAEEARREEARRFLHQELRSRPNHPPISGNRFEFDDFDEDEDFNTTEESESESEGELDAATREMRRQADKNTDFNGDSSNFKVERGFVSMLRKTGKKVNRLRGGSDASLAGVSGDRGRNGLKIKVSFAQQDMVIGEGAGWDTSSEEYYTDEEEPPLPEIPATSGHSPATHTQSGVQASPPRSEQVASAGFQSTDDAPHPSPPQKSLEKADPADMNRQRRLEQTMALLSGNSTPAASEGSQSTNRSPPLGSSQHGVSPKEKNSPPSSSNSNSRQISGFIPPSQRHRMLQEQQQQQRSTASLPSSVSNNSSAARASPDSLDSSASRTSSPARGNNPAYPDDNARLRSTSQTESSSKSPSGIPLVYDMSASPKRPMPKSNKGGAGLRLSSLMRAMEPSGEPRSNNEGSADNDNPHEDASFLSYLDHLDENDTYGVESPGYPPLDDCPQKQSRDPKQSTPRLGEGGRGKDMIPERLASLPQAGSPSGTSTRLTSAGSRNGDNSRDNENHSSSVNSNHRPPTSRSSQESSRGTLDPHVVIPITTLLSGPLPTHLSDAHIFIQQLRKAHDNLQQELDSVRVHMSKGTGRARSDSSDSQKHKKLALSTLEQENDQLCRELDLLRQERAKLIASYSEPKDQRSPLLSQPRNSGHKEMNGTSAHRSSSQPLPDERVHHSSHHYHYHRGYRPNGAGGTQPPTSNGKNGGSAYGLPSSSPALPSPSSGTSSTSSLSVSSPGYPTLTPRESSMLPAVRTSRSGTSATPTTDMNSARVTSLRQKANYNGAASPLPAGYSAAPTATRSATTPSGILTGRFI